METWEPAENCINCSDLTREYIVKYGSKFINKPDSTINITY